HSGQIEKRLAGRLVKLSDLRVALQKPESAAKDAPPDDTLRQAAEIFETAAAASPIWAPFAEVPHDLNLVRAAKVRGQVLKAEGQLRGGVEARVFGADAP